MITLRTEMLFECLADIAVRQDIGVTPLGIRRVYYVSGGKFWGPRLRGKILRSGGDWLLRRRDGASEIDVRATLQTDDGQIIYTYYGGIYYASAEVKNRLRKHQSVDESEYYFRTTPRFETGSAKYDWLNRIISVGVGKRTPTGVAYTVYTIL